MELRCGDVLKTQGVKIIANAIHGIKVIPPPADHLIAVR